ncbi:hypothetical protein [Corynebacterium sp.]|uniref:hypothetical protein n=1 Tax=Corynebacterium sp. TaxID=1720 RepID=UPI0026DB9480|nr:hypothetical protein [Corynebacterium sp.]MDO4609135.1 hypothetical protein [Corynebacterium sp.]
MNDDLWRDRDDDDWWGGRNGPGEQPNHPHVGRRDRELAVDAAEELVDVLGRTVDWTFAVRRPTLPEAILDAVFSIRMRHSAVDAALGRFRIWTSDRGRPVETTDELAAALVVMPRGILPGNRCAGRLKADIAREAAERLAALGIRDRDDLLAVMVDDPGMVEAAWRSVRGLGEQSWTHLRMLAGCPGPMPGPAVRRWLGGARRVGGERATVVVAYAAHLLDVSPVDVEYAITRAAAVRPGGLVIDRVF